jgi:hypothetical protein
MKGSGVRVPASALRETQQTRGFRRPLRSPANAVGQRSGQQEAVPERSRSGRWAAMPALIDDDVLGLFAALGDDPEAIASAVREHVGSIADRVGLVADATDPTVLAAVAAAIGGTSVWCASCPGPFPIMWCLGSSRASTCRANTRRRTR